MSKLIGSTVQAKPKSRPDEGAALMPRQSPSPGLAGTTHFVVFHEEYI